ncbi:MAG: 4-hydroxybenzoate octaprenyltransferase [Nitrospina sp.]|nr:MAG: 4-hydroxybenzoate octaprenyltransferase [Nitrospina sp.]TDJ59571.1 MAG: 4-hydroxybenzoate octaprenyltransferase [Nitrospina sp.]
MLAKLKIIFSDIKIQHTVFALPFAVMSAFLAAEGLPEWKTLGWILVAMFGARNSAMAFNRMVDAKLDANNPRTSNRALPAGKLTLTQYAVFLVLSSALLIGASYMLNPLAFYLSPVALAIVFFYSITKRFTVWSHIYLGFALACAPVGAWVAVKEEISLVSLILGAAVVFWLTGFDIIYSCLDVEADHKSDLYSIPRRFGVDRALKIAYGTHALMIFFLLGVLWHPAVGVLYGIGVIAVAGLLVYEHSLVKSDDLSKVNFAFFNVNGMIGIGLMCVVIADVIWV